MLKIYSRYKLLRRAVRLRFTGYVQGDYVLPFVETPAPEEAEKNDKQINAADLFSMFTANIITENKVFVR